jgi:hypothetical protein
LLVRSNPVIAIVATGVATHLPLRTVEKRNPRILIPLTSVVAGDKARLLIRGNPKNTVVATGVANDLSLRTAEKRNPYRLFPSQVLLYALSVAFPSAYIP